MEEEFFKTYFQTLTIFFARNKGRFERLTVYCDLETKSYVTVVLKKEILDPATSVLYPLQLQKWTKEEDYVPDKSSVLLRPSCFVHFLNNLTCSFEEQESTDANMRSAKTEKLIFLFCANISGDFIVKPLLLYRKLC